MFSTSRKLDVMQHAYAIKCSIDSSFLFVHLQFITAKPDSPPEHCIHSGCKRQWGFCFLFLWTVSCWKRHEEANVSFILYVCLFFSGLSLKSHKVRESPENKAGPESEFLLCRRVLPELYINECCSCRGTINSVVIIIDFPQVIIICYILDIRVFNAASQIAFWLIGTMFRGGCNTKAALTRSAVPLPNQEDPSLSFFKFLLILCEQIVRMENSCIFSSLNQSGSLQPC